MGDILERESERGQEEGGRGEKGYERKGGTTTHTHKMFALPKNRE